MRDGLNPGKVYPQLPQFKQHRVIVPVYIPESSGYFADSLAILRLSLESLWLSAGERISITVIANNCSREVLDDLAAMAGAGRIDQLVVNSVNRGKVDAVTAAARASFEELITITDADVLFRPGWTEAVTDILTRFPECGFVSPAPNPALAFSYTSATVLGSLCRGELQLAKAVSDDDLDRFAHSVGRSDWFTPEDRSKQLVVRRGEVAACVGGGHFVFTLRRELVAHIPPAASLQALKVGAERFWLDEPPDRHGYWKLATPIAYAYHMGNVLEPWMPDLLAQDRGRTPPGLSAAVLPPLRRHWSAWLPFYLRPRLTDRLRPLYRRRARRSLESAPQTSAESTRVTSGFKGPFA